MSLPERFKERMIAMLGKREAEALFDCIENTDAAKAFRVNRIKTDIENFEVSDPKIDRKSIDFPPDAYLTREEFPGSLACHHSGAIYMQDASAMSTVHAADLPEGAIILDSCSAPGGKTTQLAAAVGESGIVIANEYDRKRCRILQGNVERMGCKNVVVCNLDTAVVAETYPSFFDIVLCDAPCSGEGMFRKNSRAVEEWSEDNIKMCAERQREILENVAKCVKSGGKLIYSTCTFAIEENEENVAWFLDSHHDFRLIEVKNDLRAHTSDGIMIDGCEYDMKKCRRIYPHTSLGEGQFIAVLERVSDSEKVSENKQKSDKKRKNAPEVKKTRAELEMLSAARNFLNENLVTVPSGELMMLGELVFLAPVVNSEAKGEQTTLRLPPYNVFAAGVCVGEVVKGRVVPHHQLFSAYGRDFKLKIMLSGNSDEAMRYLRGEEIAASEDMISPDSARKNGWAAVLIDGCAAGGAKVSGAIAKNHYPKGLRENNR